MTSSSPFRDSMHLTPAGDPGSYSGQIASMWTIGPKVHGGTMLAICASAATRHIRDAVVDESSAPMSALAVSANFLSAPDPGHVSVDVVTQKLGRQVGVADVVLSQNGRTAVRAVVTTGRPDSVQPKHQTSSALANMPVSPPPEALRVTGDHPMANIVNVAQGCDLRIDPASARFLTGQEGELEIRMWVRPFEDDERDPDTAVLFALMAGDISAPVTMNRGMFGWAPTVQLTVYLRKQPTPGWLRVAATSTVVGDTWFEEDHLVIDSTGAVVVQSRQLAMVPR